MPDSFIHKTERPWPNRRLKIAAIVGHTAPNASRVWFRTARPGGYRVLYFDREDEGALAWFEQHKARTPLGEDAIAEARQAGISVKEAGEVGWDGDTTFVVDLDSLKEATFYRYALYSADEDRVILGHDRDYGFRTPPSERGDFSFGLYSCHMPFKAGKLFKKNTEIVNMDMWEHFHATLSRHRDAKGNMDFVIAGGDQAYVDGVKTLNIWKHLNGVMRKEGGELLPDVETMVSWYRDIYRGYWGFDVVRRVFSSFPTYMIWDDHELGDGWGSYFLSDDPEQDELDEILPGLAEKGLDRADGLELIARMRTAGFRVYEEYEHCHNPPTERNRYDYSFTHRRCAAFYVLDGRGCRDVNRSSYKILGREQMERFKNYVAGLDGQKVSFLFVVSAVPVVHMRSALVNAEDNPIIDVANLQDDLRDAWEWEDHKEEREELMNALFGAAKRGIRVCILSGDVHVSAAFRIADGDKNLIYQLTSSAITYNVGKAAAFVLAAGVPDDGTTEEGHGFERLSLYTKPSYALIKVSPEKGSAVFQLYGEQSVETPSKFMGQRNIQVEDAVQPLSHSVAKIELTWPR